MRIKLRKRIQKCALFIIFLGLIVFVVQYFSIIKAELVYYAKGLSKNAAKDEKKQIIAKDKDFGLIIPKIGVNVSVISQVDPFDSKKYQQALAKGVAHVKDTALPDEQGNVVIFAHSSDSFYHANRYNSIFYLLNKLESEDGIYLTYKNKIYKYQLAEKSIIKDDQLEYMQTSKEYKLTLITCWPPGLTYKRLVVTAKLID